MDISEKFTCECDKYDHINKSKSAKKKNNKNYSLNKKSSDSKRGKEKVSYSSPKAGSKRKKYLEKGKGDIKKHTKDSSNAKKLKREKRKASERVTENNSTENYDRSTNGNDEIDERINEELTERHGVEEAERETETEIDYNPLHLKWKFSRKELKSLKENGIKVKMGQWSKKENERLKKNMEVYLKENKLTDPLPLIFRKHGRTASHAKNSQFYQILAKGIDRPLFNIYRRVFRIYNPENNVGLWTESEKNDLLRYHAIYGDQWTKIGNMLGRSGMAVNHKYLLTQKSSPGYCKWTELELDQLNGSVRASTNTEFGAQIRGDIDWTAVSNFVGGRTPEQCRRKWLSDICWVNVNGDKNIKWKDSDDVLLIERLYSGPEFDENNIDWDEMCKEFSNAPSFRWLRLRWLTLKKATPNFIDCDFEEVLDYLHNEYRPSLKTRMVQKKTTCPSTLNFSK